MFRRICCRRGALPLKATSSRNTNPQQIELAAHSIEHRLLKGSSTGASFRIFKSTRIIRGFMFSDAEKFMALLRRAQCPKTALLNLLLGTPAITGEYSRPLTTIGVKPMQTNRNREIIEELYRALVLLGADSDLLATVGSWGDSLPDEDVLANLKAWNEATAKEATGRIEHFEMSSRRPSGSRDESRKTA